MKKCISLLLCLTVLIHGGCASIVHGKSQTVLVETQPVGATVGINRTHETAVTPAELVLKRKHEYELEVTKAGYRTQYVQIDRNLGGWFWANLLFGGIIGIVVDLVTGAGYNLEPEEVRLTLQRQ